MNIYPTRKQFLEWAKSKNYLPISGEVNVSNFDPIHLFKQLFNNNDEAFLFESGKGSSKISRYTFLGVSNKCYVKITEKNEIFNSSLSRRRFVESLRNSSFSKK